MEVDLGNIMGCYGEISEALLEELPITNNLGTNETTISEEPESDKVKILIPGEVFKISSRRITPEDLDLATEALRGLTKDETRFFSARGRTS